LLLEAQAVGLAGVVAARIRERELERLAVLVDLPVAVAVVPARLGELALSRAGSNGSGASVRSHVGLGQYCSLDARAAKPRYQVRAKSSQSKAMPSARRTRASASSGFCVFQTV
jgi:hypothetical protein